MTNLLISVVLFAASAFAMAVAVRYGLKGGRKIDSYFIQKTHSGHDGFRWYYRIPFAIGTIPEYFFALILGYDNYFKRNWWALKTASFISMILFLAVLKSRLTVYSYFTFNFIADHGIAALFTSGSLIWFLNFISLLYFAVFILLCYESIKMHGFYAPLRIIYYSILCFFLAALTMISISLIIFLSLIYFAFKLLIFFFFSSKKTQQDQVEEETAGSILKGGLNKFRNDLYQWEHQVSDTDNHHQTKTVKKKKRPKITRRRKKAPPKDPDIPRIYPD